MGTSLILSITAVARLWGNTAKACEPQEVAAAKARRVRQLNQIANDPAASPKEKQARSPVVPPPGRAMAWPKDWSAYLGRTVTVEGTAANCKLGALLEGEHGDIWIDGLEAWPDGFYSGDGKGKRLRVTGTVIQRDDLPVFIQKPGEFSPLQGIPVESEEQLQKQKWRFLFQSAKWSGNTADQPRPAD